MKTLALSLALATGLVSASAAAAETYALDASHSQIIFSYNHLGFSTTYGAFSGFDGTIEYMADAPETSSVTVSFPVASMFTGWEKRTGHFMSPGLLNAAANTDVVFTSTGIEVTGENTALITGDLTLNGITKSVVLDTTLNKAGVHPQNGQEWLGLDATTTLIRSDFDAGMAAPFVSDEVEVIISIEAGAS